MASGRYLRRFDPDRFHPTRLLDLEAVPVRELEAEAVAGHRLTDRDFRRGWYTRTVDGTLVGYCASVEGPVLFLGDRGVPLHPARHRLSFEVLGGFPEHVDDAIAVRISLLAGDRAEVSFVCRGLVKTCDDWGLEDEPEDLFHDLRREMAEPGFRALMTVAAGPGGTLLADLRSDAVSDDVLEAIVRALKALALVLTGSALLAVGLWARGWF